MKRLNFLKALIGVPIVAKIVQDTSKITSVTVTNRGAGYKEPLFKANFDRPYIMDDNNKIVVWQDTNGVYHIAKNE